MTREPMTVSLFPRPNVYVKPHPFRDLCEGVGLAVLMIVIAVLIMGGL